MMITKAINQFNVNNYDTSTVIGEFSGRDSAAAIIKAFEQDDVTYILPIASFAGTEYGDFDSIYENYLKLKERIELLYGDKKTLYPLLEHNNEKLWHLVNGRYTSEMINRYKFYNPCIGCHLYFHVTKIKYAEKLSKRIISGERESHDGKVKVNQLKQSLESYKSILNTLGFELMMPLQHMNKGSEVEDLIGWDWPEGKDHPKCVLSGNYRGVSGQAIYKELLLTIFLKKYITPIGLAMGDYVLDQITYDELNERIKVNL